MKDHGERLVLLPFAVDCIPCSGIALAKLQPKKSNSDAALPKTKQGNGKKEKSSCRERLKETVKNFTFSKLKKPTGWHKLLNKIKGLSRYFVFYGRDSDDEVEEPEPEIVIGLPTNVRHLTHIGLDGKITTAPGAARDWEQLNSHGKSPPDISLSVKRLELAMTVETNLQPPPVK